MISSFSLFFMRTIPIHSKLVLICKANVRMTSSRNHVTSAVEAVSRATVRNVPSESTVALSFLYSDASTKRSRRFNFRRHRDEPLDVVKARIVANIEKQAEKKAKRKSKKTEDSVAVAPDDAGLKVEVLLKHEGQEDCWRPIGGDALCSEAFSDGNRLCVGSSVYEVVVNPPAVTSLSLPANIMASFPVHPRVELEFANFQHSSFAWYRSNRGDDGEDQVWEPVGGQYFYVTQTEDIGRLLRVVCTPRTEAEASGEPCEAISKVAVGAGPGLCPFDNRHQYTQTITDRGSFRFVSYNVLADLYADSDFSREVLYPYCPAYALALDYRKQLLCKELSGYNADVICLQEVDEKVYERELKPTLEAMGIDGTFQLKGGQVAEGLACFYRRSKFSRKSSQRIILAEEIQENPLFADFMAAVNRNARLKETFLQRTTALQVTVLESVEDPSEVLCVGNTHLFFRPDRDNVRLLQAGMCVAYLEQVVAAEVSKLSKGNVAAILCGDFNSTPECGVYQLVTTRFVPDDHRDWSSNADEVVREFSLSHALQMESACGTPLYTNFTAGFADCLDYIFIDRTKLAVQRSIPLPDEQELRQHVALPSVTMPSDHVALVADICWTNERFGSDTPTS